MTFELNPRLAADTIEICDTQLCKLLLMNDSRFVWCILVPKVANAVEWHDLEQANILFLEMLKVSKIVKELEGIDKINIGSLGNVVRQLHIHVVGRKIGDAAWAGPVWGSGEAVPYQEEVAQDLIEKIRTALDVKVA